MLTEQRKRVLLERLKRQGRIVAKDMSAELDLSDAMTATTLALKQVELKTGRLADRGATLYEAAFQVLDPGAKIDVQFRSGGGMMFDLDDKHYQFTRTQTSVDGSIAEWRNVKSHFITTALREGKVLYEVAA